MHSRLAVPLIAVSLPFAAVAEAATNAGIDLSPRAASPGDRIKVSGYGWPGGNCRGTATLLFRQGDLRVRLGRHELGPERRPDGVGPTGRDFTARVRVPRSAVAGPARLVARQRCGDDVLERSARLRVRAPR